MWPIGAVRFLILVFLVKGLRKSYLYNVVLFSLQKTSENEIHLHFSGFGLWTGVAVDFLRKSPDSRNNMFSTNNTWTIQRQFLPSFVITAYICQISFDISHPNSEWPVP